MAYASERFQRDCVTNYTPVTTRRNFARPGVKKVIHKLVHSPAGVYTISRSKKGPQTQQLKEITSMSNYYNEKSTKRFSFGVSRNTTSHQAGANVVTIGTRPVDGQQYSTGTTQIQMTVKEARALQSFLNESLSVDMSADSASTDV